MLQQTLSIIFHYHSNTVSGHKEESGQLSDKYMSSPMESKAFNFINIPTFSK